MHSTVVQSLIQTIQQSILKQDTEHPLFHGSWDWHSSVHGHWALLHYAQKQRDDQLLAWLYARFSSDSLSLEFQYLQENIDFERPYGRAWLLTMSIAYCRANMPVNILPEVSVLAQDVWRNIQEETPTSKEGEYNNHCWVLLQLYMWFSFVKDQQKQQELQGWVARYHQTQGNHPCEDQHRAEFFSCWGIQGVLLGQVLGKGFVRKWLQKQSFSGQDLSVIDSVQSVHHLGMNATRAWGFWAAWKATQEVVWKEAYTVHLQASLRLHERWKEDHYSYAHWVPQFTLYALYIDEIHAIL